MPARLGPPASSAPARFEPAREPRKLSVGEASDVVSLGKDGFLAVGDLSRRAELLGADGSRRRVTLPGVREGRSGLEAVAFDPSRNNLFVVSEEDRRLYRYDFDPGRSKPRLERSFELDLGGPRNKGVEGLAFLPRQFSPTGLDQLVLAKEAEPRMLALLDANGTGRPRPIVLDPEVEEACRDFSGLAVDPLTGNLFLCSDESATVAELRLWKEGKTVHASLVQALPLVDRDGRALEKVEGITFDEAGNLHVLEEGRRTLLRLDRLG